MSTNKVAVLATLAIKPEAAEHFVASMCEVRAKVLANEAGCERYDIAQGPTPGTYRIFELYESAEAFAQHNQMAYVAEAAIMLSMALAGAPTIELHDVIS
ncbi:putative quinol monooxygenase [Novosphingobium sp.]|uniref:putative quinol monooxygenase n=1 Tax=Novosphingobium sp. TaxID=1874826 RepID=UPI003BAD2D8B